MNTPQSETALQAQIVQWLRWSLQRDVVMTAFPAGGGGKVRGAKLKRMGLLAGMPDILLFWCTNAFGLEVKTARGRLSAEQVACHKALFDTGIKVDVVRSIADVERSLMAWRIPLKSRIAAE